MPTDNIPPCPMPGCGGECQRDHAVIFCVKCQYLVPLDAHPQVCAEHELVKDMANCSSKYYQIDLQEMVKLIHRAKAIEAGAKGET